MISERLILRLVRVPHNTINFAHFQRSLFSSTPSKSIKTKSSKKLPQTLPTNSLHDDLLSFGLNNKKQLLAVMVDLTSEEKLKHMSLGQTLDLIKSLSTKQLFEAI